MISLGKRLAYTLIIVAVFFATLEGVLRLAGFEFQPERIRVGPEYAGAGRIFRNSRTKWWEPLPGASPFNEDGFIGPRIPEERTPGVFRAALLGDSCTQIGNPPYSGLLRDHLTRAWDRPVEILNAGVIGYSTDQGLRHLAEDVLPYRPDVVTLYFGWNDHWLWQPRTDRELMSARRNPSLDGRLGPLASSRLVQAGLLGSALLRQISIRKPPPGAQNVFRVPIAEYRENLRKMVRMIEQNEAIPILITAPTDLNSDTPIERFPMLTGLPQEKCRNVKELHDAYIEATRDVGSETRAILVDAATTFAVEEALIMEDHIHLSPKGTEMMAELLARVILPLMDPGKKVECRRATD